MVVVVVVVKEEEEEDGGDVCSRLRTIGREGGCAEGGEEGARESGRADGGGRRGRVVSGHEHEQRTSSNVMPRVSEQR